MIYTGKNHGTVLRNCLIFPVLSLGAINIVNILVYEDMHWENFGKILYFVQNIPIFFIEMVELFAHFFREKNGKMLYLSQNVLAIFPSVDIII